MLAFIVAIGTFAGNPSDLDEPALTIIKYLEKKELPDDLPNTIPEDVRQDIKVKIWKDRETPKSGSRFVDDAYKVAREEIEFWKNMKPPKECSALDFFYRTKFEEMLGGTVGELGKAICIACSWCFVGSIVVFLTSVLTKIVDTLSKILTRIVGSLIKMVKTHHKRIETLCAAHLRFTFCTIIHLCKALT